MNFKRIIRGVKRRKQKIKMYFSYYVLEKNKNTEKEVEQKRNKIAYNFLKREYKDFIDNMKIDEQEKKTNNKIWWCWLQGEENAPALNKACLNSLKRNLKDFEIVVVTKENYSNYVEFPEYIIKKWESGIITNTHFSDLLRIELLIKYGGTWIDSSVLCTSYNENFFKKDLFVFSSWTPSNLCATNLSSWFMTSCSNNPILITTVKLLYEYWRINDYLIDYFLLHIFFTLACEKYFDEWNKVPRYSNVPPHILQFELTAEYDKSRFQEIKKMSSIHKLNQKLDFSYCKGNTNYDYILKEYLE